jgi:hypothetical protein
MASLNLAGKTSGYVKLQAPDDSSNNPTVTLPTESGELALKSDIGEGGGGTGGGVEAQPPVAFDLAMTTNLNVANSTETVIPFNNAVIDTDNGLTGNVYVVKKAGLYDLSYSAKIGKTDDMIWVAGFLKVNGNKIITDNNNFDYNTKVTRISLSNSKVVELEVGDEISVAIDGATSSASSFECYFNNTFLSGHMVSSITEGEVKEKEAVVFKGVINSDKTVLNGGWSVVSLDKIYTDENDKSYGKDSDLVDGKFKPSVAGWYQINASINSNGVPPSDQTVVGVRKNGVDVIHGSNTATSTASYSSNCSSIVYLNGTTDELELITYFQGSGTSVISNLALGTFLTASLITGQSTGGGSGGGDYTPEKMVWENANSYRELDTVYTNDTDVPRYVSVHVNTGGSNNAYVSFFIDGVTHGNMGQGTVQGTNYNYGMFIVPAGSTYEVRKSASGDVIKGQWREARMPVAVGTGGKTVAFRGELSADQTVVDVTTTKVNLDTASIDTDNAFSDGKFQPSVAGYYQVNATLIGSGNSLQTRPFIYKNDEIYSRGNDNYTTGGSNASSTISDIVYLNGTTDYIELHGYIRSLKFAKNTFLSAVLVSGGSASGDSATLESLGIANHDKVDVRESDGHIIAYGGMSLKDLITSTEAPNVYIDGVGSLRKSTATTYTAEEVDKKLAIKDKLIEKLSDRLDKLEKKLKK